MPQTEERDEPHARVASGRRRPQRHERAQQSTRNGRERRDERDEGARRARRKNQKFGVACRAQQFDETRECTARERRDACPVDAVRDAAAPTYARARARTRTTTTTPRLPRVLDERSPHARQHPRHNRHVDARVGDAKTERTRSARLVFRENDAAAGAVFRATRSARALPRLRSSAHVAPLEVSRLRCKHRGPQRGDGDSEALERTAREGGRKNRAHALGRQLGRPTKRFCRVVDCAATLRLSITVLLLGAGAVVVIPTGVVVFTVVVRVRISVVVVVVVVVVPSVLRLLLSRAVVATRSVSTVVFEFLLRVVPARRVPVAAKVE